MAFDAVTYALLNKKKADLVDGKVPAEQLPSYISDAVEVETLSDLPRPGQTGVIYVTKDTGNTYRWTGTDYVNVSESNHHISVKVSRDALVNMSDLETYINNINSQGLHVLFDMSDFIPNAYVCTVLLFTQNTKKYCLIFDIINGRTYVSYDGYAQSEKVEDYVSRTGDDLIRAIKITDSNTTMAQIRDLLGQINVIGHHVMFDVSALNVGSYLCTIFIDGDKVKIHDVVTASVMQAQYDGTKKLTALLTDLADIVTAELTQLPDGTYSLEI